MKKAGCGITLLLALFHGPALAGTAVHHAPPSWSGFEMIMWQPKTERQYQALKDLGVTAAMVQADRAAETAASARQKTSAIVRAGLRPYVENIATDFYSAYHRWSPGKPVNEQFLAAQRAIAANPDDNSVFIRHPGLSDPDALARITKRITRIVRLYAPYRPLYFDLGDETGIADLSAAWDFDFSPSSLSAMRRWLKAQYGTLAALNQEWGATFARWTDVVPPTTTQTMMRTDGNYSAWSDFKEWMDLSFSRAIAAGTEAVHAGAPWARAAIEGAQMPGWGGYDYTRLAPSVDVMELYDAGQSLELAKAFNPRLTTLTTFDWSQPGALHGAWLEFLRGVRGIVIWDSNDRIVAADGSLGPDGRTVAAFLKGIRSAPAATIMASRAEQARIAVLYSPRSYRLQWLLDHRAMGASWTRLGSEDENADNAVRAGRRRVLGLLNGFALSPHFISEAQIEAGLLDERRDRIVILPQTLSLSFRTAEAIRKFVRAGGTLITVGETGLFDGHGRRLARPQLSSLLNSGNPRAITLAKDDVAATRQLRDALERARIGQPVQITSASEGTATFDHFEYRNGPVRLLALLAKPSAGQTQSLAKAQISVPRRSYFYDVGAERFLGHVKHLSVTTVSTGPTVLAISDRPFSKATCRSLLRRPTCPKEIAP